MAHRLEDSVGTPMPPALDALSARLDEISRDLAKALEAPKTLSLEPVERQISEMAQQLTRAEAQLAKIGEIESALLQLIERVDASPSPDEVASKAAEEAARRVADEVKLSGDTAERLDAMHRDLMAMNDRTKSSDDKLAGTIEAVHASLKELAQQVERAARRQPPPCAVPRSRRRRRPPSRAFRSPSACATWRQCPACRVSSACRNGDGKQRRAQGRRDQRRQGRLGQGKPAPRLARCRSPRLRLASAAPGGARSASRLSISTRRPRAARPARRRLDSEYDIPDDLVAAARRAAQAAAAKAEERGSGSRIRRLPGDGETATGSELPAAASGRSSSFALPCCSPSARHCFIAACGPSPEPEVTPPAIEQSMPAPAAPSEGAATPDAGDGAPAAGEPTPETPATPGSGSSELDWQPEVTPAPNDAADAGSHGNFTDVAKSPTASRSTARREAQAQPASLTQDQTPALPPGVVFAVEDPSMGVQGQAPPLPPLPPLPRCRWAFLCRPPISGRCRCVKRQRKAMRARNTRSRFVTPKARAPRRI